MSLIKVKNVSDTEYAGIKPGEIGEIEKIKWGPYQFALKKVVEEPKQQVRKPDLSKPKEKIDFKILLQAFNYAAGGPARAALLIGIERSTYFDWNKGNYPPCSYQMPTWEDLMELLTDDEKVLFKSKVVELCQEEAQKIPTKKSLMKSKKGSSKIRRTPKSQKSSKTRGEAEQKD